MLAASLAAPLALASCGKKNSGETQPPITPVAASSANDAPPGVAEPVPAADPMVVSGSFEGLDDVMATFKKIGESYVPDNGFDPKSELQAGLLGMGFGPGFLTNIDLDGVHAFTSASPLSGGRPEDTSVSISLAVVDGRKLIENLPASQRPSPLGEGMWELTIEDTRLLINEQGKELLLGLSTEDIATASSLRATVQPGPRLRLRASNIPTDDIDPAAVLDELPSDSKLVQDLSAVLRELDAVTVDTDLGTTRDLQLQAFAEAPFHRLGLGPIGAARGASTAIEARLPPDPVFVTTVSWGDPALLHSLIDAVPMDQVPDPVKGMVEKAVASVHTILDQIASDVVLALYLDGKGQATFVLAADVNDAGKAKAALQGVHEVLAEGVATQATMAGKNKDGAFSAKLELDGLKVAGGKADRLTVTIPKDFQEDARKAKMFLRKNSLEAVSHVDEGTAVLAIGAGARTIVTDVAKNLGKDRKQSLAQHAGLQRLRESMGGCQVCMSGDPLAYFRFRLMLLRDGSDDKAVVKEVGQQMNALKKVSPIGLPGAGVKVESERGGFGLVVPQATLFAPPTSVETLSDVLEFVDDPEVVITAEMKSSGKKG